MVDQQHPPIIRIKHISLIPISIRDQIVESTLEVSCSVQ